MGNDLHTIKSVKYSLEGDPIIDFHLKHRCVILHKGCDYLKMSFRKCKVEGSTLFVLQLLNLVRDIVWKPFVSLIFET
jgi:hypothetical protein